MRYIKYINEHNQETEVLYKKVNNADHWEQFKKRATVDFTSEELYNIRNKYGPFFFEGYPKTAVRYCIYFNILNDKKRIVISKFDDEWFLISVITDPESKFTKHRIHNYECDSIDGVYQLIDDIQNNSIRR